jgi:hypothetical protein
MKKEIDIEKFWEDARLRQEELERIADAVEAKTGVRIPTKTIDRKKIEEDVEYVKTHSKLIEERIIAVTDELFESDKERELLHISIRVSCDFHKFLIDFGDEPPTEEARFVADTIRGGIDWFYLLAFHCHGIKKDIANWSFEQKATSSFRDLRAACLSRFEALCQPSAKAGELLAALLGFIHLELVFMAQTFPSVVNSNLKADQWKP